VHWTWDVDKAAANRAKHRWHTIGLVGALLLLVIHTWLEGETNGDGPVGRIISARKATAHERKAYEEGNF
jgi:uncharacterized protein